MASRNAGKTEDLNTSEDFESLLKEDSDSDGEEECDMDYDAEVDERMAAEEESENVDMEVTEHSNVKEATVKYEDGRESTISPSVHLKMDTEEAEEIPPNMTHDVVVTIKKSPSSVSDLEVDAALCGDDFTKEENSFHLADEHQVFQQLAEQRQQPQHEQRQEAGAPQWVRGNRLIEVHVDDDDVPEEMTEMATERVTTRARTQKMEEAKPHEKESMVADNGEDESLLGGGDVSTRFEWSSMRDYSGEREQFLPERTGAVVAAENEYEAFRQYWDDGILSHIVTETNKYAARLAISSARFARDWHDTNIHEILVLFSFWMMLGIIKMPSTKSCFTTNPLLQVNIFRKMFSRQRYENLCRTLHFNDSSKRPTNANNRLFYLEPISNHLNSRFMEAYIPSQNICIDESLTLWKGPLSFRQYAKTKAAKFGVKTYELCESSTGYLWSFFVYIGSETTYDPAFPSTLLRSTSTVLKLVHPLLDKGYTLFMDSGFNSPLLARFLKKRKTDCAGTLRASRRNVPPLMSLCDLQDGQFVARHSGDVVALAFKDKKRKIITISTYHGNSQGQMPPKPHRPHQYKPQVILDYHKSMGGVDRKDQMLSPYEIERKRCAKWYMKVFKRLLNCSIFNSRILLQASTAFSKGKDHLVFRLELVNQILERHLQHVPTVRLGTNAVSAKLNLPLVRNQKHWPQKIDKFLKTGRRVRRRCFWCSKHKTQRRTSYVCSECDVALCLSCFKVYHDSKS